MPGVFIDSPGLVLSKYLLFRLIKRDFFEKRFHAGDNIVAEVTPVA